MKIIKNRLFLALSYSYLSYTPSLWCILSNDHRTRSSYASLLCQILKSSCLHNIPPFSVLHSFWHSHLCSLSACPSSTVDSALSRTPPLSPVRFHLALNLSSSPFQLLQHRNAWLFNLKRDLFFSQDYLWPQLMEVINLPMCETRLWIWYGQWNLCPQEFKTYSMDRLKYACSPYRSWSMEIKHFWKYYNPPLVSSDTFISD